MGYLGIAVVQVIGRGFAVADGVADGLRHSGGTIWADPPVKLTKTQHKHSRTPRGISMSCDYIQSLTPSAFYINSIADIQPSPQPS